MFPRTALLSRGARRGPSVRQTATRHSCRCLSTSNEEPSSDYLHPAIHKARHASTDEHLSLDQNHLWHPYTSQIDPPPVLPVSHATGCTLHLEDAQQQPLLDGMSSWWAAIWGYNHPTLNVALHTQISQMSHVMFGGLTHRPATELAAMLMHMLSSSTTANHNYLNQIFYTDSGSVAVEVALKMAWQYHRGTCSQSRKTKILSVRGGYHGDTLGAMSVCDPVNGMHSAFGGVVPSQIFVSRPPCRSENRLNSSLKGCSGCTCAEIGEAAALQLALQELQDACHRHHESLAALIVEPVVQGAGGMRFYSPRYLQRARELCKEYNMLLICDEIATGFGRSGQGLFASSGVEPDILCLGKALTGGYMTLGAVVTTEKVARGVSSTPSNEESSSGVPPLPLMHGPTFMANPLACAVAVASTNLMMQPDPDCPHNTPMWQSQVRRIEAELRRNLRPAADIPGVMDVRVGGAIGVLELERPLDNTVVPYRCRELGVWLRPFGKLLYTMPPYIMTNDELKRIADAMMILAEENNWRSNDSFT